MKTELETDRLIICPIGPKYFFSTCAYACDNDNTRYMIFLCGQKPLACLKFLFFARDQWKSANQNEFEFAVITKAGGKHIGGVSVEILEDGSGELGWVFNKNAHGKGYCTEAAKALVFWAKTELHLTKLVAHCDGKNEPSYKVMERLGMKKIHEGNRTYKDGRTSIEFMFEMEI